MTVGSRALPSNLPPRAPKGVADAAQRARLRAQREAERGHSGRRFFEEEGPRLDPGQVLPLRHRLGAEGGRVDQRHVGRDGGERRFEVPDLDRGASAQTANALSPAASRDLDRWSSIAIASTRGSIGSQLRPASRTDSTAAARVRTWTSAPRFASSSSGPIIGLR